MSTAVDEGRARHWLGLVLSLQCFENWQLGSRKDLWSVTVM